MVFRFFSQAVIFCSVLAGLVFVGESNANFEQAHVLLQNLGKDRIRNTTDASAKAGLAEDVKSVPAMVQRMINKGIVDSLNSQAPSPAGDLEHELKTALQVGPPEPGNESEAFVLPLRRQSGPSYVIAYNVAFCAACSSSWIGVAARRKDQFEIVASLDDPLPNQNLTLIPLAADVDGDRFLVYGTNWGDAHSRLNVAAYHYGGNNLKKIWSRTGLPSGKLEANSGEVTLSFLSAVRPTVKERTEVYLVTPKGIQLDRFSEHQE